MIYLAIVLTLANGSEQNYMVSRYSDSIACQIQAIDENKALLGNSLKYYCTPNLKEDLK